MDSVTQLSPTGAGASCDLGANTIMKGRAIESSITSLVEPYHMKITSRKNRVPESLPIDAVKSKKIFGGIFGRMKRQVSQISLLPPLSLNRDCASLSTMSNQVALK